MDTAPPASFLILRSPLDIKAQIQIQAQKSAWVPPLQALQRSADLYARYELSALGLWGCVGLEAGRGTTLRAEGPAKLVGGDVLRLPQVPGMRQVICLFLSLSSLIILQASRILMRSTDLILLFAAGHAAFSLVRWQMPSLSSATLAAQPSFCLLLNRVEIKPDRGHFYKADQEMVFETWHNSTFRCLGSPAWLDFALNHVEA